MPELSKNKQSAVAAIARHFCAQWQRGEGPPDATLSLDGRLIAIDVAVAAEHPPGRRTASGVRLREDVVAQRVLRDIESSLRSHIAKRKTIVLTLGAPIKVPKRLITTLTKLLLDYIHSGVEEREEKRTVLGNRVRFRVLNHHLRWTAKVIGFVFSGDPEPGALADMMRTMHDQIAATATRRMPKGFVGERWLILSREKPIGDIKTYRLAYSRLSPVPGFTKILMVFNGGRVEPLTEIEL